MEKNTTGGSASELILPVKVKAKEAGAPFFVIERILALIAVFTLFIPSVNPERVSKLIPDNVSLFTSSISYSGLISGSTQRLIDKGHIEESAFIMIFVGSILLTLGIVVIGVAACASLGNNKFKRMSIYISLGGCVSAIVGFVLGILAKGAFDGSAKADKAAAYIPKGFVFYAIIVGIVLVVTILALLTVPKSNPKDKYEMETKYKLFIMFIPFALLAFVFCYLPLWGWRYAFFDYKAGQTLSADDFVGFKWFKFLFRNAATRSDIIRVLRNTLVMSGLGILTSWVPLAFAILLTEIESIKFRRFVQTFTTVPNFISWIIVYAIAFAMFSTNGFINSVFGGDTNYLMGDNATWLKMLAWGLWKGTGWSAIIYIAGISGIDRQLYEAATVDGASRFQRIWNVTLPGLLPTYMVMLLMAVAGMLSNGLDQYLVFKNATNAKTIEVLDLYVYNLGIGDGSIPLSTVVGMAKSIISVALLFMANTISKITRGESII